MIKISNIKVPINNDDINKYLCKKLKINASDLNSVEILTQGIDARDKSQIYFVYSVAFNTKFNDGLKARYSKIVSDYTPYVEEPLVKGNKSLTNRPVIVGFGPAGIMSALVLAENGYNPIVLEQGKDIENRDIDINTFFETGKLDKYSNIQFGEGGAGAYSDGKLTSRTKHPSSHKVYNTLIKFGADPKIAYQTHPHIGTDKLKVIIKNIKEYIISLGADIRFSSHVTAINYSESKITSLTVNDKELKTDLVILAIGNGSRELFYHLKDNDIAIENKPFAVGFRIEHKRSLIDMSRYRNQENINILGSADYRMTCRTTNKKGAYSFCMCPGGMVVNASSEENRLVTNGMSQNSRDMENSNSAIVTTVNDTDYGVNLLDGLKFQEQLEEKAYVLGGANYKAPVQSVTHYIKNKSSDKINSVIPSFPNGYKVANLNELFSDEINQSLVEGLNNFNRQIPGFINSEAVITGVESRTSSPIRILRDRETQESVTVKGLYPIGEGSGYAGGIVSSAMDGVKVAESIIINYKSLKL